MGWKTDSTTGIEWYKQDSDWGCPYSCVAMVAKWVKGSEIDENDVRDRATNGSIMWPEDKTKRTEGASFELVRALLTALGIDYMEVRPPSWYSIEKLKKAQSEATLKTPVILGVRWKTNDLHMVVCAGKQPNTDTVRIADPGAGVVLNAPGIRYEPGTIQGTFNARVIEVTGVLG